MKKHVRHILYISSTSVLISERNVSIVKNPYHKELKFIGVIFETIEDRCTKNVNAGDSFKQIFCI